MSGSWIRLGVLGAIAAAVWALVGAQVLSRAHPAPAVAKAVPVGVAKRSAARTQAAAPIPSPSPSPTPYRVRHVLDVPEPMHHGDWFWNEAGAPAKGEVVITVDLAAQVLSVFRDGYEIGTAVILYGADAKPTPLGVHPVISKDRDHHSRTYGNAPMPFTLRLTDDGVAIHGSTVKPGYMTHGCIGVPIPFAKRLFAIVPVGTKVIVTRGETLAVGGAITAA